MLAIGRNSLKTCDAKSITKFRCMYYWSIMYTILSFHVDIFI